MQLVEEYHGESSTDHDDSCQPQSSSKFEWANQKMGMAGQNLKQVHTWSEDYQASLSRHRDSKPPARLYRAKSASDSSEMSYKPLLPKAANVHSCTTCLAQRRVEERFLGQMFDEPVRLLE